MLGWRAWFRCPVATPGSSPCSPRRRRSADAGATRVALTTSGALWRTGDDGAHGSALGDATLTGPMAASTAGRLLTWGPAGRALVLVASDTTPGHARRHVRVSTDPGDHFTDRADGLVALTFRHAPWDGPDLLLSTSGRGLVSLPGLDAR